MAGRWICRNAPAGIISDAAFRNARSYCNAFGHLAWSGRESGTWVRVEARLVRQSSRRSIVLAADDRRKRGTTMDTVMWAIILCGLLSIVYGAYTVSALMAADTGTPRMREIAAAIQEGAEAYLARQYTTIGVVGAAVFVIIGLLLGWLVAVGFLIGAVLSGCRRIHRHAGFGTRQRAHRAGRNPVAGRRTVHGISRRRRNGPARCRSGPAGCRDLLHGTDERLGLRSPPAGRLSTRWWRSASARR